MQRISNSYVLCLLLASAIVELTACKSAPVTPTGGDSLLAETEVLDVIREYDAAWNRKDAAAVARVLADNYVYFSSKGSVRSRQWMLEDLLGNPGYHLDHAERTELQVQLHGNTAVVNSRWQGEGSYNGEPIRDDQRCSLVVVKRVDELRVASEHCTQITP